MPLYTSTQKYTYNSTGLLCWPIAPAPMLQAGSGDGQVRNIHACKTLHSILKSNSILKFQVLLSKGTSPGKSTGTRIKMSLKTPKILQKLTFKGWRGLYKSTNMYPVPMNACKYQQVPSTSKYPRMYLEWPWVAAAPCESLRRGERLVYPCIASGWGAQIFVAVSVNSEILRSLGLEQRLPGAWCIHALLRVPQLTHALHAWGWVGWVGGADGINLRCRFGK